MNANAVIAASEDDHMILGTVISRGVDLVLIRVDHCETVPAHGQRVKVLADDTDNERGTNHA